MSKRARHKGSSASRRRNDGEPLAAGRLVRSALRLWTGALPQVLAITLLTTFPVQLLLAWAYQAQELEDEPLWQMQYQGLADWFVGSLVVAVLYRAIYDTATGSGASGAARRLGTAFRSGVGAWLGMFVTRMMVSVVVGVVMLPALGGLWLAGRLSPALADLMRSPEQIADVEISQVAPLLLVVPFLVFPLVVYLRYALVEPIVALERVDGFEALQRSASMMRGAKRVVLVGLIPLVIVLEILSLLATSLGSAAGVWVGAIITTGTATLFTVTGCFLIVLYRTRGGEGPPREDAASGSTDVVDQ